MSDQQYHQPYRQPQIPPPVDFSKSYLPQYGVVNTSFGIQPPQSFVSSSSYQPQAPPVVSSPQFYAPPKQSGFNAPQAHYSAPQPGLVPPPPHTPAQPQLGHNPSAYPFKPPQPSLSQPYAYTPAPKIDLNTPAYAPEVQSGLYRSQAYPSYDQSSGLNMPSQSHQSYIEAPPIQQYQDQLLYDQADSIGSTTWSSPRYPDSQAPSYQEPPAYTVSASKLSPSVKSLSVDSVPLSAYTALLTRSLHFQEILSSLHKKNGIRYSVLAEVTKDFKDALMFPLDSPIPSLAQEHDNLNKFQLETCSLDRVLDTCFRCNKQCPVEILRECARPHQQNAKVCLICINADYKDIDNLKDDYFSDNIYLQGEIGAEINCGLCNVTKNIENYSNLNCGVHNPVCNQCLVIYSKDNTCPIVPCSEEFPHNKLSKLQSYSIGSCSLCNRFKLKNDLNLCSARCNICFECQLKKYQDDENQFTRIVYKCAKCQGDVPSDYYLRRIIKRERVELAPQKFEEEKVPKEDLPLVPDNEKFHVQCPRCKHDKETNFREHRILCSNCDYSFCSVCTGSAFHRCTRDKVTEFYARLEAAQADAAKFSMCPSCYLPNFVNDNKMFECRNCKTQYCACCCAYSSVIDAHNSKVLHREGCTLRKANLPPHERSDKCFLCSAKEDQPCVVLPQLERPGRINGNEYSS